jgi:hypothetical protein
MPPQSPYSRDSPPVVTSLPSSPPDGYEVYYKAGSGDDAVYWQLKYDASISDAYKWRFVGGVALTSSIDTDETRATASYGDLATVGPTVTVPLAGKYEAGGRVSGFGSSTVRTVLKVGATTQADDTGAESSSGNVADSRDFYYPSLTAAANDAIKMVYFSNTGTSHWRYRRLWVRPIRVG